MTTLERTAAVWGAVSGMVVPSHLADATRARHGLPVNEEIPDADGPSLVINGRCPLWSSTSPPSIGQSRLDEQTGDLIVATLRPEDARRFVRGEKIDEFPDLTQRSSNRWLTRPWHFRTVRDEAIAFDLCLMLCERLGLTPERLRETPPRFVLAPSAKAHPSTIFDTDLGPILIDDHAIIRPGAIICGPAYIGPHSTVLDRCLIKPNTAIGPHCKVAGEVGGTIFQGYSNKAHDGHLGDSYIGEWVNLGAGTTNSNLLNTYGEVIARPFQGGSLSPKATPGRAPSAAFGESGPPERTGEQFLGAIIGDHAKFAICTRIMTGAIVGTGTMWAASAPVTGTIPPFSWATDAGTKRYNLNKFIEVATAAMARRKVTPSAAYLARIAALHAASGG
jgi:acetyltransferase-like isoleucine patch superfamily enzyme